MVGALTINFYQTPFMRGQIDVSSNVARHLSRLSPFPLQHPPFIPRRSFQLTIQADFETTDAALFNYASIFFPAELLGSGYIGHEEGTTLYYFVELDPDDVNNTVNARSLTFTLDEWATVTASPSARAIGDALVGAVGTVARGHDVGAAGDRLGSISAPADAIRGFDNETFLTAGDGVALVAVCEEAVSNDVVKTHMFTLTSASVDKYDSSALLDAVCKTPVGASIQSGWDSTAHTGGLSLIMSSMLSMLDTSYYSVIADYPAPISPSSYAFSPLTVLNVYCVPVSLLQLTNAACRGLRSVHDGVEASGVRRLLWLGDGVEAQTYYTERVHTIPVYPDRVYTLGNSAQRLTFPPANTVRRAYVRMMMRPSTGTYALYIGDGVNEIEVTESLTMPTAEIADANARETQGVRDVLAAISIAGGLVAGAYTANPTAIASSVMGAAGLVADISTRTYAAHRQTAGGGMRNVCPAGNSNGYGRLAVLGCARLEYYVPANAGALLDAFTRYGWQGDRLCDAVRLRGVLAYYQYTDDVALTISGKLETFPWLASSVRDLLVRGLRVWNDEDVTRYKNYAAVAEAVEE